MQHRSINSRVPLSHLAPPCLPDLSQRLAKQLLKPTVSNQANPRASNLDQLRKHAATD